MGLLIFYLLLALLVSFTCSVLESVLLSTPMSFLRMKEEEGSRGASRMIKVKNNLDDALAAILTLNTIAHTVGAAGVGVQSAAVFGSEYAGWTSAILTILILVFSEIIPKSIGANYWRSLAGVSGGLIQGMIWITYPLVKLSSVITRAFRGSGSDSSTSREEVSAMMGLAAEEGVLKESENKLFQNILHLREVRTEHVMTPRTVVVMADEATTLSELIAESPAFKRFSRIPIYADGNPDLVTGYVFIQHVYEQLAEDKDNMTLRELRRDIIVVPKNRALLSVWDEMLDRKEHIALVIDEYGGMAGIVTMEDIVETLLGVEIVDEKDIATDMQELARQRWEQRKKLYANKFKSDVPRNDDEE